MKIISGDLKAKNINMSCRYCNCNFEIEGREDFIVHYIRGFAPYPKIPEYSICCPVCGGEVYLGVDKRDVKLVDFPGIENTYLNAFMSAISARPD